MFVYTIPFVKHTRLGFYMVQSRGRGGWEFPGGGVEDWEQIEDAAVRETREECGCDVELVKRHDFEDGTIYSAIVTGHSGGIDEKEIEKIGIFYTLPITLAFPRSEYVFLLSICSKDVKI